jgi:hypothetical protein
MTHREQPDWKERGAARYILSTGSWEEAAAPDRQSGEATRFVSFVPVSSEHSQQPTLHDETPVHLCPSATEQPSYITRGDHSAFGRAKLQENRHQASVLILRR